MPIWQSAGANALYRYDQLNRPTEWSLQRNGVLGHEFQAYNFDYNEWGFVDRYFRDDKLFVNGSIINPEYNSKGELDSYAIDGQRIDYTYDNRGNLTRRTGGGLLTPMMVSLPPVSNDYHTGNPYHRDGWLYDADGRVTWDGEASYEYNRSGRIFKWRAMINGGLYTQRNVYDPFGNRVATIEPDEVTYTVRDLDGRVVIEDRYQAQAAKDLGIPAGREDFIYQNDQLFAVTEQFGSSRSVQTRWRFTDWLGSTAVRWTGTEASEFDWHSPYGDKGNDVNGRAVGLMGPGGFTGHENDTTGLVYMKARFMDPLAGRFNRPDPARDFSPAMPSSYNLYQYARNNPINIVDPSGADTFQVGLTGLTTFSIGPFSFTFEVTVGIVTDGQNLGGFLTVGIPDFGPARGPAVGGFVHAGFAYEWTTAETIFDLRGGEWSLGLGGGFGIAFSARFTQGFGGRYNGGLLTMGGGYGFAGGAGANVTVLTSLNWALDAIQDTYFLDNLGVAEHPNPCHQATNCSQLNRPGFFSSSEIVRDTSTGRLTYASALRRTEKAQEAEERQRIIQWIRTY